MIEPRHGSFRDETFFQLCRDHNVAIVFGDDDQFPCIDADTANFAYARLQRMREAVSTAMTRSAGCVRQACPALAGRRPRRLHFHDQRGKSSSASSGRLFRIGSAFNLR